MGIGESSFYKLVKSKKQLFLLCLAHYRDTVGHKRESALFSQKSARLGVRAFFKNILDELEDKRNPRVCLMAARISTDVLADAELRQYILKEVGEFGMLFLKFLQEARIYYRRLGRSRVYFP